MDGSIASIGAICVYGESGPTPSSGNPGVQNQPWKWDGSTVRVDRSMPWIVSEQVSVPMDQSLEGSTVSVGIQCVDLGVKIQ